MSVKTKTKAAKKPILAKKSKQQILADEYIEVSSRVALLNADPAHARHKELGEALQNFGTPKPANNKVVVTGTLGSVILGPKANEREILDAKAALKALKKAVGENVWNLIKVNLGILDKYLTEDEAKGLVKSTQTGRRSVKIVEGTL